MFSNLVLVFFLKWKNTDKKGKRKKVQYDYSYVCFRKEEEVKEETHMHCVYVQ